MLRRKEYEVSLRLPNISAFFERPKFEPFSPLYEPYSYTSGIEFIANEIYADPSRTSIRATILLPADKLTPNLEERTAAAVRRWCLAQLKEIEHNLRSLRWTGIRSLVFALALLFGLTAASELLRGFDAFAIQVLKTGLSVAGWVALWFPVQSLTYDIWTQRIDRSVYTRVMNMDLSIRADERRHHEPASALGSGMP